MSLGLPDLAAPALITAARIKAFAPRADELVLATSLQIAADKAEISTAKRVRYWLAQLFVESAGLTRFEEDLSYSAERLTQVWPARFPTLAVAAPYARSPRALAERVYGGRMGNSQPGDGWRFRGRGLDQTTGRSNYARLGELTGLDLIANPDQLSVPRTAARCAGAFWATHGCNALADANDLEGVTLAINGGLNGLEDRRAALQRAASIWRDGAPTPSLTLSGHDVLQAAVRLPGDPR